MRALIAALIAATTSPQAATPAATQATTTIKDGDDRPLPIPLTTETWRTMDQGQRDRYLDVTLQALHRNPELLACTDLDAGHLAAGIDRDAKPGDPLMIAVAATVYRLCPSA